MFRKIKKYFLEKHYEIHFFYLIFLNRKDYTTFKVISKKKANAQWNWNNIIFPLIVIFSPYILTVVHHYFGTVEFNKSFLEILIGGSITLLGINVLRTSSTSSDEQNNRENIPSELASQLDEVESQITSIRQKLNRRSWALSFFGLIFYVLQIGLLIKNNNSAIYIFLFIILLISALSILLGRFISLLTTNLYDNEQRIKLLFKSLVNKDDEFKSLEEQLTKKGLI